LHKRARRCRLHIEVRSASTTGGLGAALVTKSVRALSKPETNAGGGTMNGQRTRKTPAGRPIPGNPREIASVPAANSGIHN
jgi:hypothetical protein